MLCFGISMSPPGEFVSLCSAHQAKPWAFLFFSVTLLWLDTPAHKVTTCMPVPSHYFQHRSATASSSPSLLSNQQRRHFTESCSARAGLTGGCSGLCHWGFSPPFKKEKYWSEQRTPNTKASLRHHLFLGIGECRLQRPLHSQGAHTRALCKVTLGGEQFPFTLSCPDV